MLMFQPISARRSQIYWARCFTKIQTNVLTSTAFWSSQLFKNESACSSTRMTSRTSSVIPFYIIKTSSMNSELLNQRKRRMMPRQPLRPRPLNNWNRKWYRSLFKITNQRMARIQLFSTPCTWITSANWILILRAPPLNRQLLSPRDHTLSKVHNMTLNQSTRTETTTRRKRAANQCRSRHHHYRTLRWVWLTYPPVNSHNLKSIWALITEQINSAKALKLSSKIETLPTRRMENNNCLKWLGIFNSRTARPWNPSLTSAPHILSSRTCRHDQLKYY